jgi:MOSC domain-containing protein YiiM
MEQALSSLSVSGVVASVHRNASHTFSKEQVEAVMVVAGLGVQGDAHSGSTVQHLSRVAADPTQPNLRQVHLLHGELHDELQASGFRVYPGDLGENITTRGIKLLDLPVGSVLKIGDTAMIALTGLRNPCKQINAFQEGLLGKVLGRDEEGHLVRKGGVMGVVVHGGRIEAGDTIAISLPPEPFIPMERI